MVYIYLKDKHEKEPLHLLSLSFLFGILSAFLTLLISWPLDAIISIDEKNVSEQAIHAFFLVALVEELCKFAYIRGILYRNTNFNEPFDGIVYAVMVGMGFATFENVIYVSEGGIGVALLRMFTAVPAHATFAILMGYFLGRAKFEHRKSYLAIYGLVTAVLFHGLYDYFWFISFVPGIWLGAIASLLVAILLSRKAIKLHQEASPFRPMSENPDSTEIKKPG
jgi:RsiW-degrading membrane proteinase PrsW (M82 family)